MKRIQAFSTLGFVVMFLLCVGFFMQKEDERNKRLEMEKILASSVEEKSHMETALKGEIQEREKKIEYLFARLEKAQKINARLTANIQRRSSRLYLAAQNKKEVELQKIVISSLQELEGKVLAVDKQSDLVVINLGDINSVKAGDRFSIYRGSEFIANIELVKVQNQLSAGAILSEKKDIKIAVNDLVKRF